MIGKLDADERVLSESVDLGEQPMQLTPELISKINEYMAIRKEMGLTTGYLLTSMKYK